jgi:hypothetical protein
MVLPAAQFPQRFASVPSRPQSFLWLPPLGTYNEKYIVYSYFIYYYFYSVQTTIQCQGMYVICANIINMLLICYY